MSRRDYELIARVIRRVATRRDACLNLATAFAEELKKDNSNFNRERFVAACMDVETSKGHGSVKT